MADAFEQHWSRFLRAAGRSAGSRAGRRATTAALALAVLVLAAHRLLGWFPALEGLRGWVLGAVAAVLCAWLLAALAGFLASRLGRPSVAAVARRLDDGLRLEDGLDAALSARRASSPSPLAPLVVARAARGLAAADPDAFWAPPRARRGRRVWFPAIALFLLLAPGVLPLFGVLPPAEADRWLGKHARASLSASPRAPWHDWRACVASDAPFPAPYEADVCLQVDGGPLLGPCGRVRVEPGAEGPASLAVDGRAVPGAEPWLEPGRHQVVAWLLPSAGPWRAALVSPPLEVVVPPGEGGDGGRSPKESPPKPGPGAPKPPAAAPPPPPAPAPPPPPAPEPVAGAPKAAPAPEARFHDEVVEPLDRGGPKVRKDSAVVAVRDENAGTKPREPVPLGEALRDVERVLERAVAAERVRPSDRDFLRRYLEALARAAGAK